MSTMSDLAAARTAAARERFTLPTVDDEVIYVESLVCPNDGPLVRIEIEEQDEGWRSAYLTPEQARALAASLHVYAYRATSEARIDA